MNKKITLAAGSLIAALAIGSGGALAAPLSTSVPTTMNFTARVSDGSGPITGALSLNFKIYDAATSGTLLWEETHGSANADNGLVYAELGSIDPINNGLDVTVFASGDAWLELSIDGTTQTPRLKVGAVPYAAVAAVAAVAGSAERLGSYTENDVAPISHTHSAADINSGTLDNARFSCYADLGAEGRLDNNSSSDLLTRSQSDARYVNVGEGINADTLTSGTISLSRFDAYSDLIASGRLDNNSSSDLLNRGQADARYINGSNIGGFWTGLATQGTVDIADGGTGWEYCSLIYSHIIAGGACSVENDATTGWSVKANAYNISGAQVQCRMMCLNLD